MNRILILLASLLVVGTLSADDESVSRIASNIDLRFVSSYSG